MSYSTILILPTLATIFFFLSFCYIVFSVFKKDKKKNFDKYSKIPLND
jgi:cbb3-type cytochrome oxidase subunit 3